MTFCQWMGLYFGNFCGWVPMFLYLAMSLLPSVQLHSLKCFLRATMLEMWSHDVTNMNHGCTYHIVKNNDTLSDAAFEEHFMALIMICPVNELNCRINCDDAWNRVGVNTSSYINKLSGSSPRALVMFLRRLPCAFRLTTLRDAQLEHLFYTLYCEQ